MRAVGKQRLVLVGALLVSALACTQAKEARQQEPSANFDLRDVEPFLTRVAALLDSGFTTADAKTLTATIAQQPVESEHEYAYTVVANGNRSALRIVVHMDDVNAPDIAFFTEGDLAGRIQAAIQSYVQEAGK